MAYSDIDRKRFSYLLTLGVEDFELKTFFSECRMRLIQRGAKVQNLPHGTKNRVHMLAYQLPRSADDIIRGWFSTHLTMTDPEEAEAIVGVFQRYESVDEVLSEQSARRYARSCLVRLFEPEPSESLLAFLRTPIERASSGAQEDSSAAEPGLAVVAASGYSDSLLDVLVDFAEGRDVDEHLEGLESDLASFIVGLQAGSQGKAQEAKEALDALQSGTRIRNVLAKFLQQREARSIGKESSATGVQLVDLVRFAGSFDLEEDEVIGYCTNAEYPSKVFVKPLVALHGSRAYLLTDDDRRQLFPRTGDLMAFDGHGYPRQPERHQLGSWRVAEHDTDKPTRYHLVSEDRGIYEVRSVPYVSTEYDSVREFLKHQAQQTSGAARQPVLFLLKDGLIVGPRRDRQNLSGNDAYEDGLLAWSALPGLRLEGRLLVPGPLPKETEIYECADLASTVKKLFKAGAKGAKTAAGLTKAQFRDLVQSLASGQSSRDALRIQRIRAELGRLEEYPDAMEALVGQLLSDPSVALRIDQAVSVEANRRLSEKNDLESDIARLREEREEWLGRIKANREEHKKLRNDTIKVVRSAFERARADGVATLAEVAVLHALWPAGPATVSNDPPQPGSASRGVQPRPSRLTPRSDTVVQALRNLGVPHRSAAAIAAAGDVALATGLIVNVRGVAARSAAMALAAIAGREPILIDATIGMVDAGFLKQVLEATPLCDSLAVLDANLSALDIYGRPLLDLVVSRIVGPPSESATALFLSLCEGVGSLPTPRTFDSVSIILDLDREYPYSRDGLEALMDVATNREDGTLLKRLWRPAADLVRAKLESMDEEKRALALSVLAGQ